MRWCVAYGESEAWIEVDDEATEDARWDAFGDAADKLAAQLPPLVSGGRVFVVASEADLLFEAATVRDCG